MSPSEARYTEAENDLRVEGVALASLTICVRSMTVFWLVEVIDLGCSETGDEQVEVGLRFTTRCWRHNFGKLVLRREGLALTHDT